FFGWNLPQIIVDGHQIIGLAPGIGKLGLEEIFKALVTEPPVPLIPHLAKMLSKLGKLLVLLLVQPLLPTQDFIDSSQDRLGSRFIHSSPRYSPVSPQPDVFASGKDPHTHSSGTDC